MATSTEPDPHPPAAPAHPPDTRPPANRWLLAVALTVQFMVALDVSVVNVALPAVRADLGFSEGSLTWMINAYTLAFGGLMMLGGRLGDIVGRRRTLLGGLVVFGLASLAGGLMWNPSGLITARAVQGAGAAALAPVVLALLMATFPPGPALSRALALWGATGAAGGAVGALLGGILTQAVSWRAVMLINVPIVAFALVAATRITPDHHRRPAPRLDLAGAVLVTAAMSVLVLGVVRTREHPWGSATTVLTLATAAVLLVAFAAVESRTADPLLRLRLLTVRPVLGANIYMALLFSAQFAFFYFVSLYSHQILGYGATATGAAFLPYLAGVVVGSVIGTRAVTRLGLRGLLVAGGLVATVGFGWFGLALAAEGGFAGAVLGPSLLASVGVGLAIVPLGTAATGGVDQREAGMASGLFNSLRQVGGSIGLAVLDTVAASFISHRGGAGRVSALADGYGLAIGLGGGLMLLATLAAALLVPARPGAARPVPPHPAAVAARPDTV